jgi:hypothetical protein
VELNPVEDKFAVAEEVGGEVEVGGGGEASYY